MSDINYVRNRSGWLYLASVLERDWCKIVGWAMVPQRPSGANLCSRADDQRAAKSSTWLNSAFRLGYPIRKTLAPKTSCQGLVASMSRKGNC